MNRSLKTKGHQQLNVKKKLPNGSLFLINLYYEFESKLIQRVNYNSVSFHLRDYEIFTIGGDVNIS